MDFQTDGKHIKLYQYHPDGPAACAFVALFGLGTIGHFAEMCRLRTWYFIPMVIGGIMETFGYYGRFWASRQPQNFKAFVLQSLLTVSAPIFLGATIYVALARVVTMLEANELSPIRPRWISKIFILWDVLCFIAQIAGLGMQVTTDASIQRIGGKIVIVGLVLQMLVFVGFIALIATFHHRLGNTQNNNRSESTSYMMKVVRDVQAIYFASVCVLLRNLVRVIEYAQGFDGPVQSNEAFIYVFDASLMFLVLAVFLALHPGRVAHKIRKAQERLSQPDVETESLRPKEESK